MRTSITFLSLILGFVLTAGHALAQPYPNKPIRIIVPYPAGGVLDSLTLGVMRPLTEKRGASINGYRIGFYRGERRGDPHRVLAAACGGGAARDLRPDRPSPVVGGWPAGGGYALAHLER